VSTISNEAVEGAIAAAANGSARAQEAFRAAHTCNEEIELCGEDPAHGNNWAQCRVWPSWGKEIFSGYKGNELEVWGHFECGEAVYRFELQVALIGSNGKTAAAEARVYKETTGNAPGFERTWACHPAELYKAWVWGRFWNDHYYDGGGRGAGNMKTEWYASALEEKPEQCPEGTIIVPEFESVSPE
jgi:hypothetical protein